MFVRRTKGNGPGSGIESLKVGLRDGFRTLHKASVAEREGLKERWAREGREVYSTEGVRCGCGKAALWAWKNKGWCRGCYQEEQPRCI